MTLRNPVSAENRFWLAEVYALRGENFRALGMVDKAEASYAQALRLNSGNRTANDALARLQGTKSGNFALTRFLIMLVLGVETSCDDTAAAVLRDGRASLLANVVSSQDHIHGPYGGVVPELASRQHIQNILPIIDAALQQAGDHGKRSGRHGCHLRSGLGGFVVGRPVDD